eukprot:jgi/Botrbrau1/22374/Bobra.0002s0051.1
MWWVLRIKVFASPTSTVVLVSGRKKPANTPKDYDYKNYFNKNAPTGEIRGLENAGKRGPGRPRTKVAADGDGRDVELGQGGKREIWRSFFLHPSHL